MRSFWHDTREDVSRSFLDEFTKFFDYVPVYVLLFNTRPNKRDSDRLKMEMYETEVNVSIVGYESGHFFNKKNETLISAPIICIFCEQLPVAKHYYFASLCIRIKQQNEHSKLPTFLHLQKKWVISSSHNKK